MYFTEQPKKLLERLLNHTLDHFHIDIPTSTIVISYKGKTCEVFSESVEKIYAAAFNAYQEQTNHYQEAMRQYEEIEQAYLLDQSVAAEEIAKQQQLVKDAEPREYSQWYEELIIAVIKDDWDSFERAINLISE